MTDVYISIPKPRTHEGSSFTATAKFRNGTASEAPTTAQYRIDCLTTKREIKAWTDLTPAESISITTTGTDNAIIDGNNRTELKQITVQANQSTDGQTRDNVIYRVENNRGF